MATTSKYFDYIAPNIYQNKIKGNYFIRSRRGSQVLGTGPAELAKAKRIVAAFPKRRADRLAYKYRKPDLYKKIIELAETKQFNAERIGAHPAVTALNKGKEISSGAILRILRENKGEKFVAELIRLNPTVHFKGEARISLEKNIPSLMKEYYAGASTPALTKTYLPFSSEAGAGRSATVLEDVIRENLDPKKMAKRPVIWGSNQVATRAQQIKDLTKFQTYLGKNVNKFKDRKTARLNLKNLSDNANTGILRNFVARTNVLRKFYSNPESIPGLKVSNQVKKYISHLPAQDFIVEELRALGYSEKTIKSIEQVQHAVQKMTTASTQLEHALPRAIIRGLELPRKYHLMAERTTNFLNKFKKQFDGQMKNAAMTYAESGQTPADYKTYIKKRDLIRNKVRNLTGGYEIGYVDFDKAGNVKPVTPQASLLEKGKYSSVQEAGIEKFKKNIQYHNTLKKNFNKNPNNPDFFTLREEIAESPRKFVREIAIAEKINAGNPNFKKLVEKRVGCASGCLAKVAQEQPGKITQALETLPQKARGFLSLLGRGGVKAAPYAALAAAGAAIEPLVKKFMVDDPTTYLTDENQMKGMLLATLEGEPPKVDEEILKWQYPAAGAAAATAIPGSAAMYKARRLPFKSVKRGIDRAAMGPARAALGPVGKFLAGSFSPLGVAATLPISIAAERKGGTDWGDIATDPGHWMGPAFASAGAEMATKGIKNPLLLKAIRLGMKPSTLRFISSKLGMPGLALTAGMWGYDRWKKARDD